MEPATQIYPQRVEYTRKTRGLSADPTFKVEFVPTDSRDDIISNARYGFDVRTSRLLSRIHVFALEGNNTPQPSAGSWLRVRSYALDYVAGEFGKSVLSAVRVFGSDDTAEFYRHDFTYYGADRYKSTQPSFSSPRPWADLNGINALETATSSGAGGHAFLGVGVVSCPTFHAGVGGTFSIDVNVGQTSLVDVDGDGVADVLSAGDLANPGQAGTYLWRNVLPGHDPGSMTASFVPTTFSRAPGELSGGFQGDLSISLGVHVLQELGAAGYDFALSSTRQYTLLTDIQGDGRPDLLRVPQPLEVLVGQPSNVNVYLNPFTNGAQPTQFGLSSGDPSYALTDLVPSSTEMRVSTQTANVAAPWYHRTDPLIRWSAMDYGGAVHISGPVKLPVDASADGVVASIVLARGATSGTGHDEQPIWTHTIRPHDIDNPCEPGPNGGCGGGLDVPALQLGDRLFFYVDAVDDIQGDVVQWAPRVQYTSIVESAECVFNTSQNLPCSPLPQPSDVQAYSWEDDFRLADRDFAGWTAAVGGVVEITGTLTRPNTSVTVTAKAYLRRPVSVTGLPDLAYAFPTAPLPASTVQNTVNDTTHPTYTLEEITDCSQRLDASSMALSVPFHCLSSASSRIKPGDQLVLSVVVPTNADPGQFHLDDVAVEFKRVDWQPQAGGPTEGDLEVFGCDPDPPAGSMTVPVCQIDGGHTLPKAVVHGVASPAIGTKPPSNAPHESPSTGRNDPMVGWYRGWSVAEWNAGSDGTPKPFREDAMYAGTANDPYLISLTIEQRSGGDLAPVPAVAPMAPAPHGEEFHEPAPLDRSDTPLWRGGGLDSYISKNELRPSRISGLEIDPITGVITDRTGRLGHAWNAPGLRSGHGSGDGLDFTLAVIGGGVVTNDSYSDQELVDLDGDRRPDALSVNPSNHNAVQWQRQVSDGPTSHFTSPAVPVEGWEDDPSGARLRHTSTRSFRGGLSLGSAASALSAKNTAGSVARSVLSAIPSFGSVFSESATKEDLIDINGDGLTDRVSVEGGVLTYRLNLGHRFGKFRTMAWPVHQLTTFSPFQEVDFVDGSLEEADQDALHDEASVSYSAEISAAPLGVSASGGVTATRRRGLWQLVDVNGDGLPDRVTKSPNTSYFVVSINLGDHFADPQNWPAPSWGAYLGDDSDTLTYEVGNSVSVSANYTNQANIAWLCLLVEASAHGHVSNTGIDGVPPVTDQAQLFFQDIDGDGTPDHVLKRTNDPTVYARLNPTGRANLLHSVSRPFGGSFEIGYDREGNRVGNDEDGHPADMPHSQWVLSSVIVHDGLDHDYAQTFRYFGSGIYDRAERESYGYGHVVSAVRSGGATDAQVATLVETWYHNDSYYRRGLAYDVQTKDAAGHLLHREQTDYTPVAVGLDPSPLSYFPAATEHRTYLYERADLVKTLRTRTTYDAVGNVTQVDDDGDIADGATDDDVRYTIEYAQYTSSGIWRVTQVEALDPTHSPPTVLRHRTADYYASTGALWHVTDLLSGGRNPDTGADYNGDPSTNPTYSYSYDDFGNLISSRDASEFTLTYTYGDATYARVTRVADSLGYASTTSFHQRFGVPETIADVNGVVTGAVEQFVFDDFGRVSMVLAPGDTMTSASVVNAYGPRTAAPTWAVTEHHDARHPSDPITTVSFVDGLGRTIQTKRDAEIDGSTDNGSTDHGTLVGRVVSGLVEWDPLGRASYRSQPTFEPFSASAVQLRGTQRDHATHYEYDEQSRVVEIDTPDGHSTAMTYGHAVLDGVDRLTTTVTDPLSRARSVFRDARGRTVAVLEHNTIGTQFQDLTTRYSYDRLGQLRAVTDTEGNVTTAEYDTRGLMVSLNNPDTGLTEYEYTKAGDLGARMTAFTRQQWGTPIYYRRQYHRLTEIDYPDQPAITFAYGPSTAIDNSAGRLVYRNDGGAGNITYTYGPLGQVTHSHYVLGGSNSVPGSIVDFDYAWDNEGRMLSLRYPDGEVVSYDYNYGGQLKSVTGARPMEPTTQYVSAITYDEFGARRWLQYGNGVTTEYHYDPAMRRLSNVDSTLPTGTALQRMEFGYDAAGQLTSENNNLFASPDPQVGGPQAQTFGYDDLGQLTSAVGQYLGPDGSSYNYQLTMAYDAIGNITHQTQTDRVVRPGMSESTRGGERDWAYQYNDPLHPHQVSWAGPRAMAYDASGHRYFSNNTATGAYQYSWEGANERVSGTWDGGPVAAQFYYDADGNRTHKIYGSHLTLYAGQFYTIHDHERATQHVFAGDTRVASTVVPFQPDGTPGAETGRYWYHSDQLQSVTYVTNENATVVEHAEYFPFGDNWINESWNSDELGFGFTGKTFDPESGYYDFGARMYDPQVGQWLSTDPALAEYMTGGTAGVRFPQNLGLYSYGWNSPIQLSDRDGRIIRVAQDVDRAALLNLLQALTRDTLHWEGDRLAFDRVGGRALPAGTMLLRRMIDSGHTTTIVNGSDFREHNDNEGAAQTAGVGSDSSISVNLDPGYSPTLPLVIGTGVQEGHDPQPEGSAIYLGTEISHADRAARGVSQGRGPDGSAATCQQQGPRCVYGPVGTATYVDSTGVTRVDTEYMEELTVHLGSGGLDPRRSTVTEPQLRREHHLHRRGSYNFGTSLPAYTPRTGAAPPVPSH